MAMRRTPLKPGTKRLRRRTKLKPVNHRRRKALEEKQFGPYGQVIRAQPCWVSGRYPVDRAHVGRKRSVGAGPEMLAALHREVHTDFDDELLSDRAFQRRWRVSRADIRARAKLEYAAWLKDNPNQEDEDAEGTDQEGRRALA